MKKVLFTTTLLLFIFVSVQSQEMEKKNEKKIFFGITGGFNQNFQTSSPYSFDGLNMYVGFFAEKKISNRFGLQLEILHTIQQGSGYNTLEFPFLVKYKLNNKFSLYSGIQLNLFYQDVYSEDIYSNKPNDFAINLGITYDLSSKWYIDARFIYNTNNEKQLDKIVRNHTFRIGVGYRF
jgi:opacity protein-like surface antigen